MPKKKAAVVEELKPFVLTFDNYYSKENKGLSHSKLKDYDFDPYYFYRKHIVHEIENEETDALIMGKMVDTYLTVGKEAFERAFVPVSRRSKEGGQEGVTEVTYSMYNDAVEMAETLLAQDAIKEMEGFEVQKVLSVEEKVGEHFDRLCGLADYCKIDEKRGEAIIRDLKTTKSVDPRQYHYSCLSYRYYSQAAMYAFLIQRMYGIRKFTFEHIAIEKDDKCFRVQTFKLNTERVLGEVPWIKQTIKDIAERKDWAPRNVSFKDAVEIGFLGDYSSPLSS